MNNQNAQDEEFEIEGNQTANLISTLALSSSVGVINAVILTTVGANLLLPFSGNIWSFYAALERGGFLLPVVLLGAIIGFISGGIALFITKKKPYILIVSLISTIPLAGCAAFYIGICGSNAC